MPDAPPFPPDRTGFGQRIVSSEYNLALQQARIAALPEEMRLRLGKLMLKGWTFTLVGSELDKTDQFNDIWALSLPDHPWPALNPLEVQIKIAEKVEAHSK